MPQLHSIRVIQTAFTRYDPIRRRYLSTDSICVDLSQICCTKRSTTNPQSLQRIHNKLYDTRPYQIEGLQQIHSIPACPGVVQQDRQALLKAKYCPRAMPVQHFVNPG